MLMLYNAITTYILLLYNATSTVIVLLYRTSIYRRLPPTSPVPYFPFDGATKRRDCRSYACANANTRTSSPGSPTTDTLSAGIPSTPRPAGTDTSGRPSQLPYPSAVRMSGQGSTARGALKGIVGYTIAAIRAARMEAASADTTSARDRANDRPAASSAMG